ncbi:hypothetical protein SLS58_008739 [Diplodia intermedia]|uniref:Nitrogen permease regulator 2 n=1 Tax=Diplodia intermedia TaxID=856260 RepID=A0ABR3TGQ9_9PEZI
MSTHSASMFDMDLQDLLRGDLLPGQTHDTGIVEQGPKIKAIMDELEQQYIRVRDDLQRGCFTVSAMWDADRKLPIVYQGGQHADTLTTLMVYHASQNASRDLSFFIPGSSGRIRPCDSACTTMFVGLYKHIYILSSSGSVVPMPNEPANAEEEHVLDMIVTSCQRVGFLPAHPCPAQVKDVKTESLYLLRRTEAEMFTGQLIMARVMIHHQPDITVHKDDHDEDPGAAKGGHGGYTFTQHDQPTAAAASSHVASQTYTGSYTQPLRTRLVFRPKTPSASLPTESSADGGSTANNTSDMATPNSTMDLGCHFMFKLHLKDHIHWMPIETQGSMATRFNATASPNFINTSPGDFDVADARKLSESTRKRRRTANIASLDGAYSSPESSDDDDSSIATDDYDADVDIDMKNAPFSRSSARRRLNPSRSNTPQSKAATATATTTPQSSSPLAASAATSPPGGGVVDGGAPITGPNGFRTVGPLPRFTASGIDQSHKLVFRYHKNDAATGIPQYFEQRYRPRGALKHGIDWASDAHMATLNRWAAQLALRHGAPRSRGDMKEREWVAEETAYLRELAEAFARRGGMVRRRELYALFNERFGGREVEVTGRDGVKRVMKRFWRSEQALTGHVDRTGAFAALRGKWGRLGEAKKGGDDVVEGAGADDDDGVEDGVGQDGSGDGVAVDEEALAEEDVMLGM